MRWDMLEYSWMACSVTSFYVMPFGFMKSSERFTEADSIFYLYHCASLHPISLNQYRVHFNIKNILSLSKCYYTKHLPSFTLSIDNILYLLQKIFSVLLLLQEASFALLSLWSNQWKISYSPLTCSEPHLPLKPRSSVPRIPSEIALKRYKHTGTHTDTRTHTGAVRTWGWVYC